MAVKHIVLGLTAIATIGLLLKKKVADWRNVMTQLKAFPTEFRKFNANFKSISFEIDVTIFNPSNESFNPDGILAQLDRLEVDVKGQKIATVMVKRNGLQIPANGKFILRNLKVEVPVTNIMIAKNVRHYDDINVTAVINVLGEEFKI
jgi:hypothetical protein